MKTGFRCRVSGVRKKVLGSGWWGLGLWLVTCHLSLVAAFAATHVTATYDLGANPRAMATVNGTPQYGLVFAQRNKSVAYGGVEYGPSAVKGYLNSSGQLNDGAGNLWLDLIPNLGATPGDSYYVVTFNIQGRVHAEIWVVPDVASVAADVCRQAQPPSSTAPALFYQFLQREGDDLPQRQKLNFLGSGVSCVDNAGQLRTDCVFSGGGGGSAPKASATVSGTVKTDVTASDPVVYLQSSTDSLLAGKVSATRSVSTSSPLGGGGALSTDLTLSCPTCEVTGNKNAANGYAGLTASTKLNLAQMQEVMAAGDLSDLSGLFGSAPGAKAVTTALASDPTTDNCVKWIAGGKLGDAGAACGSGGGGGANTTLSNLTDPTAINLTTLTFAGAAGLAAGGTNQNVTLTPSGSGYTILNGKVGIGTATPGTPLEVYAGASSNTAVRVNTDNSYRASIFLQRAGLNKAELFADGASGLVGFNADAGSGFQIGFLSYSNEFLTVKRLGTELVGLVAGRSYGSGKGDSFVVAGGETNNYPAGDLLLRGGNATGTGTPGNIKFQKADGSADYAFIDNSTGRVGIGTNVPDSLLHVNGDIALKGAGGANRFVLTGTPTGVRTLTLPDATTALEAQANKNAANGYAGLTASAKLNLAQMQEVMGAGDLSDLSGLFGSAPGAKAVTTALASDPTADNCVKWVAGGQLGDAGAACGTGGGGGITTLNSLTATTQYFATPGTSGTAPNWSSVTDTHTLNIPLASASSVTAGLISKTDYDTFNGKPDLAASGSAGVGPSKAGTAATAARSDHDHRSVHTLTWFFPGTPATGVQNMTLTFPDGAITNLAILDMRVTVNTTSASSSTFNIQRCTASCTGTSPTFGDIYSTALTLAANTRTASKGSAPNQNVSGLAAGDQFKANLVTIGASLADVTVTMTYKYDTQN